MGRIYLVDQAVPLHVIGVLFRRTTDLDAQDLVGEAFAVVALVEQPSEGPLEHHVVARAKIQTKQAPRFLSRCFTIEILLVGYKANANATGIMTETLFEIVVTATPIF